MRVLQLLLAAALAYVLTRAAFVFIGAVVALVAVVLVLVAAAAAWRRGARAAAVGLAAGTALSLLSLAL